MNDTVKRLMALAEKWTDEVGNICGPINTHEEWEVSVRKEKLAKQALHDELTRLFTPLGQTEVVDGFCKQPHDVQFVSVFNAGARFAEQAHGIGEAK